MDNIEMAVCDRIKTSWINGEAHGGGDVLGSKFDVRSSRLQSSAQIETNLERQTLNFEPRTTSLPLNRAGRFAGDVITNPVHSFDLVDDPARNLGEDFVWDPHPIRGHPVLAFDDPQSNC